MPGAREITALATMLEDFLRPERNRLSALLPDLEEGHLARLRHVILAAGEVSDDGKVLGVMSDPALLVITVELASIDPINAITKLALLSPTLADWASKERPRALLEESAELRRKGRKRAGPTPANKRVASYWAPLARALHLLDGVERSPDSARRAYGWAQRSPLCRL
jgi:hypothetical protein